MQRQRRSSAASKGQTRAYAEHVREVAALLRTEIGAPERPHGRPAVVVLMGYPGVGKSHCARLLAQRLGAAHVASDQLRSRLFIAATYTAAENAAIFAAADALLDGLLREGHRVVLDATHLRASARTAPRETADRNGVPIVFVRVVADETSTLARLAARRASRAADDHSDADERVFQRMRAQPFEAPERYLQLNNGAELAAEVDRVADAVEQACASAS
ncbi:MAG: ATP-binding protein [Chloroflexi bacterium]|nr:ATP-binding protein [Chloroflexota bacterium]